MDKKSFFYKGPRIYKAGLRLIHGKKLDERYSIIAQQIGEQKSVLEPACGPALLPDFLHPSNNYSGFDINEKFVQYAQQNGLNVTLGNATDLNSYSSSDVVVLCDALHHMGPKNEKLVLENSLNSAKQQLIVCDPFKSYYLEMLPKWLPGAESLLETWHNYSEKDGNNQVRWDNIRTRKELEDIMMEGFGIIPKEVKRDLKNIGEDLIVTYHL